ncbi:hypothetical protein GGF32_006121 [Allomyces javanicus]|nr:hypothetical protein GGF32_006121 [Allomyces javanicus]
MPKIRATDRPASLTALQICSWTNTHNWLKECPWPKRSFQQAVWLFMALIRANSKFYKPAGKPLSLADFEDALRAVSVHYYHFGGVAGLVHLFPGHFQISANGVSLTRIVPLTTHPKFATQEALIADVLGMLHASRSTGMPWFDLKDAFAGHPALAEHNLWNVVTSVAAQPFLHVNMGGDHGVSRRRGGIERVLFPVPNSAPTPAAAPSPPAVAVAPVTPAPTPPPVAPSKTTKNETAAPRPASSPAAPAPLAQSAVGSMIPHVSNARIDVYLIKTVTDAQSASSHILATCPTIALDVEGALDRRAGGVDVVQLSVPAASKTAKPIVFLFDYARAASDAHRSSLTKALQSILDKCDVVVHDGRADADALLHQLGVQLHPVYETQTLFAEWHALTKTAIAVQAAVDAQGAPAKYRLSDAQQVKLFAAMQWIATPTRTRPGLNVILAACGLLENPLKKQFRDLFSKAVTGPNDRKTYWQLHPNAVELAEYAAYDVDQLVPAANAMVQRIEELSKWLVRARSWLHVAERLQNKTWSLAQSLPKYAPVHAQFDDDGKLVWRFALSEESESEVASKGNAEQVAEFAERTKAEVDQLFSLLPENVCAVLAAEFPDAESELNEVILDLGRRPLLRFFGTSKPAVELTQLPAVTMEDLGSIFDGRKWSSDRRGGIDGMLHRISWIADREDKVVGLTIRVGRACPPGYGVGQMLQDLVASGKSILILGKPGSGKTHTLRDLCARLSDAGNNVMVVDTSNEVGGPGNIPHFSLHRARRMQVKRRDRQFEVLLEAVQNHTPDVVVIDEISDAREVEAARSVVTRIQGMVATAHGSLDSILRNKTMRDLVGGLVSATVGDEKAKAMGGRKTVTQRAADATFTTVVELLSRTEVRVFHDVNRTVDDLLAFPKRVPWVERRWLPDPSGAPRGFFWVALEPFDEVKADLVA